MEKGFCQKDNLYINFSRGCLHPGDFCPYRTACMVYFLQKEREYEEKKNKSDKNEQIKDIK
jgi:hypothetical protein